MRDGRWKREKGRTKSVPQHGKGSGSQPLLGGQTDAVKKKTAKRHIAYRDKTGTGPGCEMQGDVRRPDAATEGRRRKKSSGSGINNEMGAASAETG